LQIQNPPRAQISDRGSDDRADAGKGRLSGAVRLANQLKIAIGVPDPDGVWKKEWGELYRDESE
jgi:hypothetical protein